MSKGGGGENMPIICQLARLKHQKNTPLRKNDRWPNSEQWGCIVRTMFSQIPPASHLTYLHRLRRSSFHWLPCHSLKTWWSGPWTPRLCLCIRTHYFILYLQVHATSKPLYLSDLQFLQNPPPLRPQTRNPHPPQLVGGSFWLFSTPRMRNSNGDRIFTVVANVHQLLHRSNQCWPPNETCDLRICSSPIIPSIPHHHSHLPHNLLWWRTYLVRCKHHNNPNRSGTQTPIPRLSPITCCELWYFFNGLRM